MEIEVGEYVRTKKGEIAKIIDIVKPINANILLFDVNLKEIWLNEVGLNIKNHSKNIIDLIEVGDYVNGYKVEKVEDGYIYVDYCWDCNLYTMVTNEIENIKSIVTKEMMKSVEYRIN